MRKQAQIFIMLYCVINFIIHTATVNKLDQYWRILWHRCIDFRSINSVLKPQNFLYTTFNIPSSGPNRPLTLPLTIILYVGFSDKNKSTFLHNNSHLSQNSPIWLHTSIFSELRDATSAVWLRERLRTNCRESYIATKVRY